MAVDRDAVARWLEASCTAQGVGVKIVDALVLRDVAVLLDGRVRGPRPRTAPPATT